jgi:hypothetical protein
MKPSDEVRAILGDAIPIDQLLRSLGYSTPAAAAQARTALEEAGLTTARKKNIDPRKMERVEAKLTSSFARYCGSRDCAAMVEIDDRELVFVARVDCEACGRRAAHRQARKLADVFRVLGFERLLVVGGGPKQHEQLRNLISGLLRVDIIDGEQRPDSSRARTLAQNADVIIVWGSTILPHKVSEAVKRPEWGHKTVEIRRRGVSALLQGAYEHCRRRGLQHVVEKRFADRAGGAHRARRMRGHVR